MTEILNAANPIVLPDGTMAPHFRDYIRQFIEEQVRLENDKLDTSIALQIFTGAAYGGH